MEARSVALSLKASRISSSTVTSHLTSDGVLHADIVPRGADTPLHETTIVNRCRSEVRWRGFLLGGRQVTDRLALFDAGRDMPDGIGIEGVWSKGLSWSAGAGGRPRIRRRCQTSPLPADCHSGHGGADAVES